MSTEEILLVSMLDHKNVQRQERAAIEHFLAQQHTAAYWLSSGVVVVDRARLAEAALGVIRG